MFQYKLLLYGVGACLWTLVCACERLGALGTASVPVSEIFSEASYDDACSGFLYGDSLFANKLVYSQVHIQVHHVFL